MDNMKHRRLQELDRSDFGIVEGEPDIRGWDVRNTSGQKIGEVEELILDAQERKIRYMVVELDDDDLDLEDDKRVLIPIGLAELDKDDDDVILPSIKLERLKTLPAYDADHLDDDAERRICSALGYDEAAGTAEPEEKKTRKRNAIIIDDKTDASKEDSPAIGSPAYYASFYQHPYFNDEHLSSNRPKEGRQQKDQNDSDYERGLRLWELRSKGGVIPDDTQSDAGRDREISDDQRREIRRDRRAAYEERRKPRKGKSIIDRINDEGLQDAKP